MGWRKHNESGEEVRSIRTWGFMKIKDRDEGGSEILYGDKGGDSANNRQHGHYGEDKDGNSDPRNRPPK